MQEELAKYKRELQAIVGGPRTVSAASVNGKSFSYGLGRNKSMAEWRAEIQDAMSQIDDNINALPNATKVRFA